MIKEKEHEFRYRGGSEKEDCSTSEQTNVRLFGPFLHHLSMFAIGCFIGVVITMMYTSFLPVGPPRKMSEHRRIMTRRDVRTPGQSTFIHLPISSAQRLKRSVQNKIVARKNATNSTTTTATPTQSENITVITVHPLIDHNGTESKCTEADCKCQFTDLKFKDICKLPFQITQLGLEEISLKDVINSVFSRTILNSFSHCEKGYYCQQPEAIWSVVTDMANRWSSGNYQAQICPLLDCLASLRKTNDCQDEKRALITQTVTMLCSMPMTRETKVKDMTCVKHVLMMEHRDLADLYAVNSTLVKDKCSDDKNALQSCNQDCKHLFTQYADMDLACDSYRYYIRNFGAWRWYYQSKLEQNCGVLPSIKQRHYSFDLIMEYKNPAVITGVLGALVLIIAIGVSVYYFHRKRRKVTYKRAPSIEGEVAEMEGLLVT